MECQVTGLEVGCDTNQLPVGQAFTPPVVLVVPSAFPSLH